MSRYCVTAITQKYGVTMEKSYFSKEMNGAYGLKVKDFTIKLKESDDAESCGHYMAWIQGVYSDRGARVGWYVSFNHELDDALYHLLNDKGDERMFKTADAAIKFLSGLNTITGSNISWV